MSVIAEYTVQSDELVLSTTLSTISVRLELERTVAIDPERPILFAWLKGDLAAFDDAVGDDPTVSDVEVLSEVDNARLYRLQVAEQTGLVLYDQWARLGAERLELHHEAGRWHVRTRFPDRETLRDYRTFLDDNDVSFTLKRLYGSEKTDDRETELTDEQREALRLAHHSGYFDIPRTTTAAELADELGISNQAVSERLRRGYAALVEETLDIE